MSRPRLALAEAEHRWIPTQSVAVQLSDAGIVAWKRAVAEDVRAATGAVGVDEAFLDRLAAIPLSPSGVDRYIFLPSTVRAFALVNVAVTPVVDGWREELIERCAHPVHLTRDTEFSELDVPWSDDGFIAIRCEEIDSVIIGTVVFAASWGDYVVMMSGTSRDLLTILELQDVGSQALAGASLL